MPEKAVATDFQGSSCGGECSRPRPRTGPSAGLSGAPPGAGVASVSACVSLDAEDDQATARSS